MDFDGQIEIQETIIVINPEELCDRIGNETLLITGSSRGGTSLVAYVYRRAGYDLGVNVNPINHEDIDALEALNPDYSRQGLKGVVSVD